jgi:hypothetical protein
MTNDSISLQRIEMEQSRMCKQWKQVGAADILFMHAYVKKGLCKGIARGRETLARALRTFCEAYFV